MVISPGQFQFVRPDAVEGFLPEKFNGAEDLGGSLTGDLLLRLEINEILADLFGTDQLRGLSIVFAQLAQAGIIRFFGARAKGQKFKIITEGF